MPVKHDRRTFLVVAGAGAALTAASAPEPAEAQTVSTNDLCDRTAIELAALIRTRKASAREVMAAHLGAHPRGQPDASTRSSPSSTTTRAWRWPTTPTGVLAKGETLGPLHGLPIAFKDLQPAVGFPYTRGSPIFAGLHADRGLGPRRAAAARRRDPHRQDQRARVRPGLAHLQQRLRHHAQSLRSRRKSAGGSSGGAAPRWPRACCRSPTAATWAARCATPATSTTSSACARRSAWCRRRRPRCRSSASSSTARWPARWGMSPCC